MKVSDKPSILVLIYKKLELFFGNKCKINFTVSKALKDELNK
jgi:hypothetical protein